MAQSWSSRFWRFGIATLLAMGSSLASSSGDCSFAQIVPNGTLGAESSQVTSKSLGAFQINGGATRGENLFHSFSQFSVPTNGIAYFNNSLNVKNIISRVMGGFVSTIDGKLRAQGSANLFLINPNGIIFGPNASLNIGGSFIATTASSIKFADGIQFSATSPQTTPVLTVNVPIGLQFGRTAESILVQGQGSALKVNLGETLGLVGGDVTLEGGALSAPGGRIELGSVAGNNLVTLNPTVKSWTLGYEGVHNFQNIQLKQRTSNGVEYPSVVDASDQGGGDIHVQGRHVMIADGSEIMTVSFGPEPGGNIILAASDSVQLTGSNSALLSLATASGAAGNIELNTGKLLIQNGAVVSTESVLTADSFGQVTPASGQGGNLTVNASESIELINGSLLRSTTQGPGNAGNIKINTNWLFIQDGAAVDVSSQGRISTSSGSAGNLEVKARSIYLDNKAILRAESTAGQGNINLKSQNLLLRHGSSITTNATDTATGGNITIKTGVLTALENSDISANAKEGFGGRVTINAQGIFATEFQQQPTPESDITATSALGPQFSGIVQINSLGVNPSLDLVNLPVQPVDVTRLIAQGCPAGIKPRISKFVVTGRGGLPPTPKEALRSEPALADLGTPIQGQENHASAATYTKTTSSDAAPIVEATGWVTNAKGEVELVATAPTVTPSIPWLTPTTCHAP